MICESKAGLLYRQVQVGQGYMVRPTLLQTIKIEGKAFLNGSTVRENVLFQRTRVQFPASIKSKPCVNCSSRGPDALFWALKATDTEVMHILCLQVAHTQK